MTTTPRTVSAVVLPTVVALAVLAGCGTDAGGTTSDSVAGATSGPATSASSSMPPAAPTEAPSRSLPGPGYAVPPVTSPLEVSGLVDDPCSLLTGGQTAELQVGAGSPTGDGSCRWQVGDTPTSVLVVGLRPGSLTSFYETYAASGDGSWEPTTVAGLPGALVNGPFEASTGSCTLVLAVSDDAWLRVERGITPDQDEACAVTTRAATLAVATLGGGTR